MSAPKNKRAKKGLTPDGELDFTGDVEESFAFRIAPDVFWCVAEAPGGSFLDLASIADAETTSEKIQAVEDFFEMVLLPESWEVFEDRFRNPQNPISMKQSLKAFEHLVKIYSGDAERPTQAPSSSPSGSETTGQSSTGTPRSEGSTRKKATSAAS